MDIRNLFTGRYWFSQPEPAEDWVLWIWLGIFLVLILTGLIVLFLRTRTPDHLLKIVFKRFGGGFVTAGFIGLVWLFFRQQRVYILGWRAWLIPGAAWFGWWLYRVIRYTRRRLPEIKAEQKQRELRERYLPKRKK